MNVIAHIRKATRGAVALENTHPFVRELWGRYWIFAHNGTLEGFAPALGRRLPAGGHHRQRARVLLMLEALRRRFRTGSRRSSVLRRCVARDHARARAGDFNYLLSNGEYLFAHCADKLCYIVRHAPFTTAHLIDDDVTVDFSALTTPDDRVAVIATTPLTDNETWTIDAPGELLVFRHGEPEAATAR